MSWWLWVIVIVVGVAAITAIYDITQKRHAILRNFPIVGHFRFFLESVGPELRQYIVTDNDEERPFSRDQRRWIYSSAKGENNYFGFGTDNDLTVAGYPFLHHSAFPVEGDADRPLGSAKVMGERRQRPGQFAPESIINISAMSFGALSGAAIEALNLGATMCGCLHNTGEGGISNHHRHGGDLVFQIGTGYFGARSDDGGFSIDNLLETMVDDPVKAIEIKLSQGAKPGLGGVLPAAKVTPEIAEARGVPVGVTVRSPARHREFDDVAGLVEFVERIADATGLPVGIKSAVGGVGFWDELAAQMATTGRGPDFITIDGAEGGTGAAPLVFSDNVALPFRRAFPVAYGAFSRQKLTDQVTFVGAGRLGFAPDAILAIAMGVDLVNVGREAMLATGCIQAQKCHTGSCPTGVATQRRRRVRGLDPTNKSERVAGYVRAVRHDLRAVAQAMGHDHPSQIRLDQIDIADGNGGLTSASELFGPGRTGA